jgi:CCR4-NOT transcriptional regulation complex NOT5 subunit
MDDQERLFKFQETETVIWNENDLSVIIYSLTDVIMVVDKDVLFYTVYIYFLGIRSFLYIKVNISGFLIICQGPTG